MLLSLLLGKMPTGNYLKCSRLSKIKRIVRNEEVYKKLKKWSFKMLRMMA